jgi:hypothetical protein
MVLHAKDDIRLKLHALAGVLAGEPYCEAGRVPDNKRMAHFDKHYLRLDGSDLAE